MLLASMKSLLSIPAPHGWCSLQDAGGQHTLQQSLSKCCLQPQAHLLLWINYPVLTLWFLLGAPLGFYIKSVKPEQGTAMETVGKVHAPKRLRACKPASREALGSRRKILAGRRVRDEISIFFMGPFRTQSLGFRVWFHGLGLGICSSGVAVEDLEIGLRCAVSSAHVFIYSGTKLGA